jgi:uncharacterized repeat protein (TIGR04138 family)
MDDPRQALFDLLQRDRRYKLEAYAFLFEALSYAHDTLGLGQEGDSEENLPGPRDKRVSKHESRRPERHLTGQELCHAIRQYALEQYGYCAKLVLNSWGVTRTGDFGEIVYNLIRIGQMRKTKQDRREDFDDVYDFDQALVQEFKISSIAEQK